MSIDLGKKIELYDGKTGLTYFVHLNTFDSTRTGEVLANLLRRGVDQKKVVVAIPKDMVRRTTGA